MQMHLLGVLFALLFLNGDLDPVRIFLVPFDHHQKDSKKIEIQVEFLNCFDEEKETVFLLENSFDELFLTVNNNLYGLESMNLISIKGRRLNETLMSDIVFSGEPDFQLAYRVFNQDQVARDIEVIRKKLLGDKQVILFGYSSAATVFQYYLSLFPRHVKRAVFLNPLVFDIQKNLSFPKVDLLFPEIKLTQEQLFDFSYYANYQAINNSREDAIMASKINLSQFLTFQDLVKGLANSSSQDKNYPLMVKMFEHSLAMSGIQSDTLKVNPVFKLLKEKSKPIWEAYTKFDFEVYGTNYDKVFEFPGKLTLIGGVNDQMIYPKSYDALAEFYADCTLLLIKDGHAIQKIIQSQMLSSLLGAFLEDDVSKKIAAYKKLTQEDFLFLKYKEGIFKLPPPF
ncbi:alpha/beta fold hydrolase [Algoriphagus pacificus]|uniref:Alpha/beta fold hydrolase n=1 Tax=Algoriphagus pacificus TaxID=2811234 RepID=A0ABS3CD90_9BACT|nr:alpha/beta fold hydrolase [Algoriphagus pacificus]MBN7815060.1 alpha/beta fold hydrolase [Algoriphagus pacificus]